MNDCMDVVFKLGSLLETENKTKKEKKKWQSSSVLSMLYRRIC